jgi:hypothetical protein
MQQYGWLIQQKFKNSETKTTNLGNEEVNQPNKKLNRKHHQ